MSDIEFLQVICPHCRKRLRVKAEFAGRQGRCPNPECGARIEIAPASLPMMEARHTVPPFKQSPDRPKLHSEPPPLPSQKASDDPLSFLSTPATPHRGTPVEMPAESHRRAAPAKPQMAYPAQKSSAGAQVVCPCGRTLAVPPELAHGTVMCPFCRRVLTLEKPPDPYEEWQRVADYRFVRKSLRPGGAASIIFGLIGIGMGVAAMQENPINAIVVAIGLFLTVEGVWLIVAPAPIGMLLDGCAFLMLGLWNIAVTILNALGGAGGPLFFAALGFFQIGWGVKRFATFAHLSEMPQSKPSAEALRRIDEIVNDLTKATMAGDPNLVEFVVKSFPGEGAWKARLGDQQFPAKRGVMCLEEGGGEEKCVV